MKESFIALTLTLVFFSCQQSQAPNDKAYNAQNQHQDKSIAHADLSEKNEKPKLTYIMVNAKQWLIEHKTDHEGQAIAFAVNRTDGSNFARMDSVVVPTDLSYTLSNYMPFPSKLDAIKEINKIVFFSYPTQAFAAYENGVLVRTGPTNMGSENHLTPTGLFYTNWKAKVSTSTVNEAWILKWNFNILNKEGIGWHQYSLPGYPVSHSCLRLLAKDAEFLYYWADQWVLADKFNVQVKGTPVMITGKYDFDSPKPWFQLISNSTSIDISEDEMQEIIEPFLNEILIEQKNRETYNELKNQPI